MIREDDQITSVQTMYSFFFVGILRSVRGAHLDKLTEDTCLLGGALLLLYLKKRKLQQLVNAALISCSPRYADGLNSKNKIFFPSKSVLTCRRHV